MRTKIESQTRPEEDNEGYKMKTKTTKKEKGSRENERARKENIIIFMYVEFKIMYLPSFRRVSYTNATIDEMCMC